MLLLKSASSPQPSPPLGVEERGFAVEDSDALVKAARPIGLSRLYNRPELGQFPLHNRQDNQHQMKPKKNPSRDGLQMCGLLRC